MPLATSSSASITCAMPACGTSTTVAESVYVDGCGQICPRCAGPELVEPGTIEPPF